MNEQTLSATTVFDGRLLKIESVKVRLDDGREATREIVRHPGAVAVLAERPDGLFVLVRQFRKAVEQAMLEIIAGTLNPGEDPLTCASREVREETGYRVRTIEFLGRMYPAPGYTSEVIHLFHARLHAEAEAQDLDADERIAVEFLSPADFAKQVAAGRIEDGKTLAAWALFRSRQPSSEGQATSRGATA